MSLLAECFARCQFAPVTTTTTEGSSQQQATSIVASNSNSNGNNNNNDNAATTKWETTSFFIDSSGRSTLSLPFELSFASQDDLNLFLSQKCLDPPPQNMVDKEKEEKAEEEEEEGKDKETIAPQSSEFAILGLQVKSYPHQQQNSTKGNVAVEEVKLVSCAVHDLVVSLQAQVTVRASNYVESDDNGNHGDDDSEEDTENNNVNFPSVVVTPKAMKVATDLEITPVLTIKKTLQLVGKDPSTENNKNNNNNNNNSDSLSDLTMALELGAIPDHMQKESRERVHETPLEAISIRVTLTHAFIIATKSMPGPDSFGHTFVSLTIRHANTHQDPVTITNISLHPGHSRILSPERSSPLSPSNRSMLGGQYSVTNMTKAVQWGYAPHTELSLPLKLDPFDAYSTLLNIHGSEEFHSRYFMSPISVTGVVGRGTSSSTTTTTAGSCPPPQQLQQQNRVVAAGDAHWSTELVAIEPGDAFRIEMTVEKSKVQLGKTMNVYLKIFNLSLEHRNLMLLIAKTSVKGKEQKHNDSNNNNTEEAEEKPSAKFEVVNAAVVSEVDGYTFGVWGISGEDDGTVPLNRDHELLAVDAALVLGDVLGQHSVSAELRFVPLREGRLQVPNWKLYDRSTGRWYACHHNLCMVATK